jgi:hypothetical protein
MIEQKDNALVSAGKLTDSSYFVRSPSPRNFSSTCLKSTTSFVTRAAAIVTTVLVYEIHYKGLLSLTQSHL